MGACISSKSKVADHRVKAKLVQPRRSWRVLNESQKIQKLSLKDVMLNRQSTATTDENEEKFDNEIS